MPTNLLIVESPSKIKTIQTYLGKLATELGLGSFIVAASLGHIRDLQKGGRDSEGGKLGVDITNHFAPHYEIIPEKKKTVQALKEKVRAADMVWLASDLDREGEAIAWHLKAVLGLRAGAYKRITFHEITASALREALLHPREIDMPLVNAQQGRRVIDRLIGFQVTQLLWRTFESSTVLSAGRVQSVVLDKIVQREEAIESFTPTAAWYCTGTFAVGSGAGFPMPDATLVEMASLTALASAPRYTLGSYEEAHAILTTLLGPKKPKKGQPLTDGFRLAHQTLHKVTENPPKPFITSSLQQEAHHQLGLSVQRTMRLAQDLYEAGLITYMRTDSFALSPVVLPSIKKHIVATWGEAYSQTRTYAQTKKTKGAQEAHEAIRPTHIETVELAKGSGSKITKDHQALYGLIWRRTVASQMTAAQYDELLLAVGHSALPTGLVFRGKTRSLVFTGYLAVYGKKTEAPLATLDATAIQCTQLAIRNEWTTPTLRYTESSLVHMMESEGIGRPSTYGSIIQKLVERQYIETVSLREGPAVEKREAEWKATTAKVAEKTTSAPIYSDKRKMAPTEMGRSICSYLRSAIPLVVDASFTAEMETSLDEIAHGETTYEASMKTFYTPFEKALKKATTTAQAKKEKVSVGEEGTRVFRVEDVEITARRARFGPVLEWTNASGEKKEYLGLKPFFAAAQKTLETLSREDVVFLRQFPRPSREHAGQTEKYGAYGFYIEDAATQKTRRLYLIREQEGTDVYRLDMLPAYRQKKKE